MSETPFPGYQFQFDADFARTFSSQALLILQHVEQNVI